MNAQAVDLINGEKPSEYTQIKRKRVQMQLFWGVGTASIEGQGGTPVFR